MRAGYTPLTAGPQITGRGFHLRCVCDFCLRKPELKLYRRVIHRKTRDRCYLKIARCQLNRGGYRRCINPERGGGRFPLLAINC
ncbi:putative tail component domain protein [Escherichia coli TW09109]|nr:putative tail component domain protein [Escherichia coli TW09109]